MLVDGEWKRAADIQPGDHMDMTAEAIGPVTPISVPWPADSRMNTRVKVDHRAYLTAPDSPRVTITPRWARLLGAFVGDGCAGQKTQITISCDGQDQDWIDLLMEDFAAVGLAAGTEVVRTWDGQVLRRRSVRVASAHLLRVLEALGLTEPRPNGRPLKRVCVPEVIWRSPSDVVAQFLAALFETDGSVGNRRPTAPSLVTKDEQFARDVQRLLLAFGVQSAVRAVQARAGSQSPWRTYWKVAMRRAGAEIFEKEIGFLSKRKQAALAVVTAPKPPNHATRITFADAQEMRRRRALGELLEDIAADFPVSRSYVGSIIRDEVWRVPHASTGRPQQWTATVHSVEPITVVPVDLQVADHEFALAGFVSHNSNLKGAEAPGQISRKDACRRPARTGVTLPACASLPAPDQAPQTASQPGLLRTRGRRA